MVITRQERIKKHRGGSTVWSIMMWEMRETEMACCYDMVGNKDRTGDMEETERVCCRSMAGNESQDRKD